jgi:hypothetical protein
VIPFVFSMSISSSVTANSAVTLSPYTEPVAMICGAVAVLYGLWSLARCKRVEKHRVRTVLFVNGLVFGAGSLHYCGARSLSEQLRT